MTPEDPQSNHDEDPNINPCVGVLAFVSSILFDDWVARSVSRAHVRVALQGMELPNDSEYHITSQK